MKAYALIGFASMLLSTLPVAYATDRTWHVDDNLTIHFAPDNKNEALCLTFILKNYGQGYVGLAFDNKLYPADTVIMWIDQKTKKAKVWDSFNHGMTTLRSFPSAISDTDSIRQSQRANNYKLNTHYKQNYTNIEGNVTHGVTTLKCCRPYATHDPLDYRIIPGNRFEVRAFYNMNQTWSEQSNYKQAPPVGADNSAPLVTEIVIPGDIKKTSLQLNKEKP